MDDKGVSEEEVIKSIYEGSLEPTRKGRILYRKNFIFNRTWRGGKYSIKQVAPIVIEEENRFVVVIVYVYYF